MEPEAEVLATLRRRVGELVERDAQVRPALPDPVITAELWRAEGPLAPTVARVMEGYADRPALGERAVEFVPDENGRRRARLLPRFDTITYGELWQRAGAVAAAWHGAAERGARAGDFVAVLGFTGIDYTVVDLACMRVGSVPVPLQAGASTAQLAPIVGETEPTVLATDLEQLGVAVELASASDSVRSLLIFDLYAEDDEHCAAVESARRRLAGTPIVVETLVELLARGRDLPGAPLHAATDPDELALLIYTSGSTGTPNGAIYPQRLLTHAWRASAEAPLPSIALGYLPMSHTMGRQSLLMCLARGGTVYFTARSDMSTLLDDFALVRPTLLGFVPRVCDMVFQVFQSEMVRRVGMGEDPAIVEREVKTELREQLLGGRFLIAVISSALLSAEMREFMASVLDIALIDAFGATETGGVLRNNKVERSVILDYKLVDVPELGYFSTDRPYPRGELLIKSRTVIPGYYKRPELSSEIFDAEGFYRTGDVMARTGPDELVYVDRRNNVLKLSQGEFVAVSKLEAVYTGSPLVRQIYVYGSSERAYLLAVIVPTAEALAAHADATRLKAAIGESLRRVAKDAELNSYEIPRDFVLETRPFTVDDGLLSGLSKLLRPKLKERYGERLEALYRERESARSRELETLRRQAGTLPVLETVSRAARALLGFSESELRPDAHFTDLGGDSLSALSFSTLLHALLGVEVPVGVIVSPANDLRRLANYIAAERSAGGTRPTVAAVHGTGAQIRAADLALGTFIDAPTLAAAPTLPRTGAPRTVLLTGANGYLGRFLCLEWLERLHDSGGTLVCVVRGADAAAAHRRLDEVFDSGDPELPDRYRALAEGTLEVLAGDIGEPNLGLSEQDWVRMADSVDLIVHAAALVNHVLPYGQLFGPNVVGTAEIIRLALTTRVKTITYLSTVAVAAQAAPEQFGEDGDIREISAVRSLDGGYADGYGNSKWAGEVLLREAHDLCGLPVAVFRSDMILAHSRFAGQLNVPDMFTRLLLSVLATGLAPNSFYETDGAGNRQRAHYDGLPADFTAQAITVLGSQVTEGFETFNVLNPHDDGRSLDEFVDWLIAAGHAIERIDDYAEWLSRFETALRGLPERQQRHSVLPLLHAYRRPAAPIPGTPLPAKKFQSAVQVAQLGPGHDIPHLTPELIEKYASDLTSRALL
ncbi:carboxylic acid reductase [Nocardia crassostreae]|uniref:carboxylic acid reductase n=1 Tax=Nocardia crassostreae TaxID=53428 RepID=UPI00082D1AFD|nr:carboxylic acid reductase [Nocardia crassostreae]